VLNGVVGSIDTPINILCDSRDGFQVQSHLASWSNVAGWQSNAYVLKFPNICYALEKIYTKSWERAVQGLFGEFISCPFKAVSISSETYRDRLNLGGKFHRLNFPTL